MKALILAAGKSTRIAEISKEKPKPLLEVAGKPVLEHNVRLLAQYGIQDIFINLHYQAQMIQEAMGDGFRMGARLHYSHEPEILGTAGAVKNLQRELDGETFLVLCGDNFTDCNIAEMLAAHKKNKWDLTIAAFDWNKTKNSGIAGGRIVCNGQKEILRFTEGALAAQENSPYVNGGIYVIEPCVFEFLPPGFSDFGKNIFPKMLQQNRRLGLHEITGYCMAIDNPQAYAATQKFAQEKIVQEKLS